jgi:hypothetical protein
MLDNISYITMWTLNEKRGFVLLENLHITVKDERTLMINSKVLNLMSCDLFCSKSVGGSDEEETQTQK